MVELYKNGKVKYEKMREDIKLKNAQLKEADAQRAESEAINFWKKKAQGAELEVAD